MFDKEKYLQMKAEKKTLSEMAEVFGITRTELERQIHWLKTEATKRCRTCKFRNTNPKDGNCNYILITHRMRGCPVIGCTKHEKGEPLKEKDDNDEEEIETAIAIGIPVGDL